MIKMIKYYHYIIGDNMKKITIVIMALIISYQFLNKTEAAVIIPDEAIRMRVVANSNSIYDQQIKLKVRNELEKTTTDLLENIDDLDLARKKINDNIDLINNKVNNVLDDENYIEGYNLNFGLNYFPEKKFKGVEYPEGYYESLVVTLGKGTGENWWCVLFPPLCLLEAEETDKKDVEYKFFIKELIDKYF